MNNPRNFLKFILCSTELLYILKAPKRERERARKVVWKNMGVLSVFDEQETMIRKEIESICPYCGGPVAAIDFDVHLVFCFLPISHKTKKKFFCTICSRRLIPSC